MTCAVGVSQGSKNSFIGNEVCVVLYFMTIMAPWSVTTIGSYTVLSTGRNVLLVLLVLAVVLNVRRRIFDFSTGFTMVVLLVFFGAGILLAFLSGAISFFGVSEVAVMLLTCLGCFVLTVDLASLSPRKVLWPLVAFCFLILLFSLQIGGMTLAVPLKLDLGFNESTYTLSGAAFWALSALFSCSLLTFEKNIVVRIVLISFALFSVLAAVSFGARGETIALFLVAAVFLFRRSRIAFAVVALAVVMLLRLAADNGLIEEFTLYARLLEVRGGYFGLRDQLLEDAFRLLTSNPLCLMTGCGFAYFQWFFGYEYGLYVHNQLVEVVIALGLPVTFCFLCLVVYGAWRLRGVPLFDGFLVYIMGFAFITALKSGNIEGSLLLMPLCFCCLSGAIRPAVRSFVVNAGDVIDAAGSTSPPLIRNGRV